MKVGWSFERLWYQGHSWIMFRDQLAWKEGQKNVCIFEYLQASELLAVLFPMFHLGREIVSHSLSENKNCSRMDTTSKGDRKFHNSGILML